MQYVDPGYLVFAREGALLAQRFDADSGRVVGEPFSIAERVRYFASTGAASFATSRTGTLAYQAQENVRSLNWFDRAGRELGTVGSPGYYLSVSISPDGRRAVFDRARPGIGTYDIWSLDFERGTETPVTSEPGTEVYPIWLPGGRSVAYSATRTTVPQLFRRDLATGKEEKLLPGGGFQIAQDVSPDGRSLAYMESSGHGWFDVWALDLSGGGKPVALLQSPFDKGDVRFSADGRSVAMITGESGQSEVYVTAYPGPGERIRVSTGGARDLRWSRDGPGAPLSLGGRAHDVGTCEDVSFARARSSDRALRTERVDLGGLRRIAGRQAIPRHRSEDCRRRASAHRRRQLGIRGPQVTLASGSRLGPYEILSPLGAGGMGEVYKAKDTRLERTVAIKVLPSHMSSSDEVRQRFEREAKTISQLSHPHICALYDVGNQDGVEYLVMEYLEGETLADRLLKGALPTEQTLRFGIEIADALDKAHRQGIVHRDLKPGNVMLTTSGVKLLDFGLAKAVAPASPPSGMTALPTMAPSPLTQEGTILGTFQYMSPEQLEGREADVRSDIFAFGAVLYEMATGKKAFSGASQASLISAIMKEEPAPIAALAPMAPRALDRVVRTCLAKDPEDRWQSARDLGAELKWIAGGGSDVAGAVAAVPSRRRGCAPSPGPRGGGRAPGARRGGRAPAPPGDRPAPAQPFASSARGVDVRSALRAHGLLARRKPRRLPRARRRGQEPSLGSLPGLAGARAPGGNGRGAQSLLVPRRPLGRLRIAQCRPVCRSGVRREPSSGSRRPGRAAARAGIAKE